MVRVGPAYHKLHVSVKPGRARNRAKPCLQVRVGQADPSSQKPRIESCAGSVEAKTASQRRGENEDFMGLTHCTVRGQMEPNHATRQARALVQSSSFRPKYNAGGRMVTPPITRSTYGPKCLISPVNKCVARSDKAASRIGTSFAGSFTPSGKGPIGRAETSFTDRSISSNRARCSGLARLRRASLRRRKETKQGSRPLIVQRLKEIVRVGMVCGGEENVGV